MQVVHFLERECHVGAVKCIIDVHEARVHDVDSHEKRDHEAFYFFEVSLWNVDGAEFDLFHLLLDLLLVLYDDAAEKSFLILAHLHGFAEMSLLLEAVRPVGELAYLRVVLEIVAALFL